MKKILKTYEMRGFNEVSTSTQYCGVKVVMEFKNGNVVMGKHARLQTDNRFAQDAIENDYRFKYGNIRLVSEVEVPDEDAPAPAPAPAEAKPRKTKKQKDTAVEVEIVDSVKTLNDLDAWFAERGVELKGSNRSYLNGLFEEHNVSFPNLKL